MKKLSLLLAIGVGLLTCQQAPKSDGTKTSDNQATVDSLTAELRAIQQKGQLIGFGVAMVNENGVLYENGFGLANLETKEPYTAQTIQHIASVSKTLIGIALMKAKEMGKLQLDDPIDQYLPFRVVNPYHPNEAITIRHLATHTSGIADTDQYMERAWILTEGQDLTKVSTDYPAQRLNPHEADVPMEEYLRGYLTPDGPFYETGNYLDFQPGERYNYSNIGATLCALVLEKATGQAFDDFTQQHILSPLGMNASGWSLADVDVTKHARLYRNDNSVLPFYTAITYPDGMLISSSSDMAKYLAELVKGYIGEGTLLSKESYQEYFTKQLEEQNFDERNPDHPYDEDYDPAIFIGHSALGYLGHSGGDAGVGTWMFINKEQKTGRYIVINTDWGNDERSRELQYYAIWDKMNEYIDRLVVE